MKHDTEALLDRLSVQELLAQLTICDISPFVKDGVFSPGLAGKALGRRGIGAIHAPKLPPEQSVRLVNDFQRFLLEETDAKIPALVVGEVLHGMVSRDMTVFPQSIALASSFDEELVGRVAAAIAAEASSAGVNQGLAPVLDLARDPRWGRTEEGYGEDPYLTSRLGVAYIRGLQGDDPLRMEAGRLCATVKHFAAHGSPEGGVNLSPVSCGPRQLRELYLKPFRAAVREAGVQAVMPAYSEFDGEPCHSSAYLLREVLRDELGFDGCVISDFGAIEMLPAFHHTADDLSDGLRQAFAAGVDLEAPGIPGFLPRMEALVESGALSLSLLRERAAALLRVKERLGLFERPYTDPALCGRTVQCGAHRALALEAARKGIVLLENRDCLLPLTDGKYRRIALIGPGGDKAQFGDYSIEKAVPSLLDGLRGQYTETEILFAKGCTYYGDGDGIGAAEELARSADAVILAVGENSVTNFGIGWGVEDSTVCLCGEGYDSCTLRLSAVQSELCRRILALKKPVVLVLTGGRPLAETALYEACGAVLEGWYGGEAGGRAMAEVISGAVNPSGRLPVSFPRSVGHIPCFYNYKPSARGFYHQPGSEKTPGRDYVTAPPDAYYSFGHGLSYTRFTYSGLRVDASRFAQTGEAEVRVTVTNAGGRAGEEALLLFVTDLVSSVTTPVKELKAFGRVSLKPGESRDVALTVRREELTIIDRSLRERFEPGEFSFQLGGLEAVVRLEG